MTEHGRTECLLDRIRTHERIEAALARVRPLLQADGIDVELIDVHDDGATVRPTGLSAESQAHRSRRELSL